MNNVFPKFYQKVSIFIIHPYSLHSIYPTLITTGGTVEKKSQCQRLDFAGSADGVTGCDHKCLYLKSIQMCIQVE